MQCLRILHEDNLLIAVDKPAGFHSHPPEDKAIRLSHRWNGLGILEKQIGQRLYPAHRLDRATSGVLVFSKCRENNSLLQRQFADRLVGKTYLCLVRGRLNGVADIREPLKTEGGRSEEAHTRFEELHAFTLPIPGPSGQDRAFTLVKAEPFTGRYHQIRRHLNHLGLPIVGDRGHGDSRLNRAFRELTGIDAMLLRCVALELDHPGTGRRLRLRATWAKPWHKVFERAGFCPIL